MKNKFSIAIIPFLLLIIGCTSADFEKQKPQLLVELPDYCPTPDGMAIDKEGNLFLACPNFADKSKPACIVKLDKDCNVKKVFDVPTFGNANVAAPMGIQFDDEGNLYICDNPGWYGTPELASKGRILKVTFNEEGAPIGIITVAYGLEHPNGIRIRDGKIYVTQSALPKIKDPSGLLVSGVYCFSVDDVSVEVKNDRTDKNLITTVVTQNKDVQYGLDGIVFDKNGNLYVGNFGDGAIHKIQFTKSGKMKSNRVWAQDLSQMRTTDGMCIDDDGNIYVADFSENAIAKVTKNGNVTRIAQSPDCDGSDGGLDQPGEPIIWNDMLVVSCFDIVTGPDKVNTKHDKPFTLSKLTINSKKHE